MWSRSVAAVTGALFVAPAAASAVDAGRMDLLAREAASVLAPAGAPAPGSWTLIAAVLTAVVVSSAAGTWIGLKSRSVARVREGRGWRELTYRFRSKDAVRADGDVLGRLAGILDEVEALSARLKDAGFPAVPRPVTTVATTAGRFVELVPVVFRRSRDAGGPVRWTPPASRAPQPAAGPLPGTESLPGVAAPAPGRADRYRDARRMLREGASRDDVRRRTGLKAAEIELLRCRGGEES
jgi:hypothetical protein